MAAVAIERTTPPDVRGPTGPFPLATLLIGAGALALVVLGTAGTQIFAAIQGGPVTLECRAAGIRHYVPPPNPALPGEGIQGAEGVCHIVMTARSAPETVVLGLGLLLGATAVVAGFSTFRRKDTRRKREHAFAGAVLGSQAVALASFALWFRQGDSMFRFVRNFFDFDLLGQPWFGFFVKGAKNTILLALGGEAGGIVLGLLLALLALSARPVVRAPARVYINFFRGTPLIWQLSFVYFGLLPGLGLQRLSAYTAALIVFALNTGAYAAEVFRAGIQSIERGQLEAARGLGLSYLQSMRYAIVPQAIRRVIPPLMNEFVILIKDTALVTVLSVAESERDLFTTAQDGYAAFSNATFFVAAAIGYLVVTLPLIRLVTAVERKLRSGLVGIVGGFGTG